MTMRNSVFSQVRKVTRLSHLMSLPETYTFLVARANSHVLL